MLSYKKIFLILISLPFLSTIAHANSEIGYYTFGQYRYFGPKMHVEEKTDGVDDYENSAQRYFPSQIKQNFNYFKNVARTAKETISYGDWDKPYRVMLGYERDDRHIRTSGGTYGRLGGGLSLSSYRSEYDNNFETKEYNAMLIAYAIYNDAKNKFRWRGRVYLGYGNNDMERQADESGATTDYSSDNNTSYYGFENSFTKEFAHQSGLFIQPYFDFNGFGIKRSSFKENNKGLEMKDRSYFLLETITGTAVGYKGTDNWNNKYSVKFGPEITYVLSNPAKSYTSTDGVYFSKPNERKEYITWKAYLNYNFKNGFGLYNDIRYYDRADNNMAFMAGVNYRF